MEVYEIVRIDILDKTHCGECEFIDPTDEEAWCIMFNEFLKKEGQGEEEKCLRCSQCVDNETHIDKPV